MENRSMESEVESLQITTEHYIWFSFDSNMPSMILICRLYFTHLESSISTFRFLSLSSAYFSSEKLGHCQIPVLAGFEQVEILRMMHVFIFSVSDTGTLGIKEILVLLSGVEPKTIQLLVRTLYH